ncbi:hypothetical protein MBIO_0873 [Mycoplasmopsis fermentans PG18]|uniref:Uncharacterized protein n=1 Tax=Mycoplasmopsis fermentans (strain ATCC 19989 / NBRC 14854 / NCTC 10117 / PG18) TaxID=496833 RepID=C4XG66_MYCFP|nr:hypothetical protein MBIO_0873 [Mycoplasmopsis fermentans PG18]
MSKTYGLAFELTKYVYPKFKLDGIFKDNFRNYGNDTEYYLKDKKAVNKILVLANTIKNHTNNFDN